MRCPKCGKSDAREWRQCPEHGGAPVCVHCCEACPYYDPDGRSIYTCRYWLVKNREIRDQAMIRKLRKMLEGEEDEAEN